MFRYLLELSEEAGDWHQSARELSPVFTFLAKGDVEAVEVAAALPQVKSGRFSVSSLCRIYAGLKVQQVSLPKTLPCGGILPHGMEREICLERFGGHCIEELVSKLQPAK